MPIGYFDKKIGTLDDINVEGKKVLLRVDINSPIDPKTGDILDDTRFRSHLETIETLIDQKAAVVIMSHQGRPTSSDFTRLDKHAKLLSSLLGTDVDYVPDVIGPEALRRIQQLSPGQVLLLDNTRLVSEDYVEAPPEVHSKGIMVMTLSKHVDYYVNDAFATAHRSQASIVGFPLVLPSVAGKLMEREVKTLSRVLSKDERPKVFVLGGAKVKDTIKVIKYVVEAGVADEILTTGLVALLFLLVSGVNIGEAESVVKSKVNEKTVETARNLIASGAPIRVPLDFYAEIDGNVELVDASNITGAPKDIGPSTIEYYSWKIRSAKIIVMRGPAGVIEDPRFRRGTRELVESALRSNAFTIFGGGHFNAILSEFPEELRSRVGHISTGGGALLYFLANRKLPGLESLARSYEKFFTGDSS
ncbi:MAG: phosphoglycerate kinase [Desulfurococcales archaeon]|nr:phosphoglycerate kinase [Desulfurococcales archaeon]